MHHRSLELAQQRALWDSYLATGRGSASLFRLIDQDDDDLLSPNDIHQFLDNIQRTENVVPKAFKVLNVRAKDHPLTFREFQDWLVQVDDESGNHHADMEPLYESHAGIRPTKERHIWNKYSMSQLVRRMQYAVRGDVVIKADKLASEGREVVYTNVGNPHSVGQPPITFYRQVLALCDLPANLGVDHPSVHLMFPEDAIRRAREMRRIIGESGTGAYTHSQGLRGFREHVANFIEERDGHAAYPGNIFLTNGASSGIEMVLQSLISGDTDAIMIPIPQYPIYSALLAKLGGRHVGYELDEDLGWTVTRDELETQYEKAQSKGLKVKGLTVINPGNPTGQVFGRRELEMICEFCVSHGLVLLADEVYQRNVYVDDRKFVSVKKVAIETPGCEDLELVSFHSTSKGLIGECGRRGGYMELHGIDRYVQSQIYKLASSGLCSCVSGQIMTSLMVKSPEEGGESYELFKREEQDIFSGLQFKAKMIVDGLNEIEGITCTPAEGAMYAFPRVELPQKAIDAAESGDITPDTLYALSLLEYTGICVVPASGFKQKRGRIGFRTTFLPPANKLKDAVREIASHHRWFVDKYSRK